MPSHRLAGIGIARLFQGNNIFPGLSVLDNMLVADNNRMGEQAWQALFHLKKTKEAERVRMGEAGLSCQNYWERKIRYGKNDTIWQEAYRLGSNGYLLLHGSS